MRLIKAGNFPLNQRTLDCKEFSGDGIPPYAILSHTWADDEVLYADIVNGTVSERKGFWKLQAFLREASDYGLEYCWADNCCINKDSSAELSEAINSMFQWYQRATICYAYLADVDSDELEDCLSSSRWVTRGWTLQELLAPKSLLFYSKTWHQLGDKYLYKSAIARATSIDESYIDGSRALESASIAERMSWAALRQTTRPEDIAYSLMGLFSVNMPMLYGEGGRKAFLRLQEEIMKISVDQSIFAWVNPELPRHEQHGLLADSPRVFLRSRTFAGFDSIDESNVFTMTSLGLHISLRLQYIGDSIYSAALMCPHPHSTDSLLAIHLKKLPDGANQFVRVRCGELYLGKEFWSPRRCYIRQVSQHPISYRDHDGFIQVNIRQGSSSAQWSAVHIWSLSSEIGDKALIPTPVKRIDHDTISDPPLVKLDKRHNAMVMVVGIESRDDGLRYALMLGCGMRNGSLSPNIGIDIVPMNGPLVIEELAQSFSSKPVRSTPIINIGDGFQLFVEVEERLKREGKIFLVDLMVQKDPLDPRNTEPVERGRRAVVSSLLKQVNRSLSRHFVR